MGTGAQILEGLRPVVDLVYPPRCPLCGDAVAAQSGLCPPCWTQLEVPGEPACQSCQRPMHPTRAGPWEQCYSCLADPPRHSGIMAATIYNDASRKLVLTFKRGGKIALAPLMAKLMSARIPPAEQAPPLLVPVPLHRGRLWSRGFNQSAFLARELSRLGRGELLVDGLVRQKRTPSLAGLSGKGRRRALEGAIRPRPAHARRIAGRNVILVDDVLTSGATSDACVEALLDAGAASVRIACFARVVD